MQLHSVPGFRTTRPATAGRRSTVTCSSANGADNSIDEIPSDAEGDVPTVALRPSGGAFRGVPTQTPGTAGAVGLLSFGRPGGGCTRFNLPQSSSVVIASGPTSSMDAPSRFSRPAGGAARMFPSGLGPGGGSGPTSGDGGSGGGSGGDSGAGGGGGGGSPADEPLGFSTLAPWALLYLGVCGTLYWAHESFIRRKPAPEPAPAAAPAAPVKSCCKKAAAAAAAAKGGK
ncbi:hypothetical protein VOLCADRAFT_116522 [Volvox carteri f. nagariensis]|uniref:Uncharacterized protein n=1 Tax=Volvox carteri f. nagariensis TaxID=3068 RepID=D8TMR8_VOLCA|nr:uncharacterized protein VOLCADRAFT_116522 [Volvox carteri f. nagariensis]EFJ51300.1 hypothetical protein VOLCADRAFT_116522 [Volvox carteri f. nagariensis]|eukprot:XP_002947767.1 hypothetical protein VOLCADRAFT_116522 [Volvox carteri f. nagariensis]